MDKLNFKTIRSGKSKCEMKLSNTFLSRSILTEDEQKEINGSGCLGYSSSTCSGPNGTVTTKESSCWIKGPCPSNGPIGCVIVWTN